MVRLTCFCYWGGMRTVNTNGTFQYAGGVSEAVLVDKNTSYEDFVEKVCCCFDINSHGKLLYYNTTRDKTKYLRLRNQQGVEMVFHLNQDEVDIFVEESKSDDCIDPVIINSRESHAMDNTIAPNGSTIRAPSQATNSLNKELGLASYSVERANEMLTGDGQYFDNPKQFKQFVTVYATIHKFSFKYLDNSRGYYRLRCSVDDCTWKLTARCDRNTDIVRVIRFNNEHTHTIQDVANYKPIIRSRQVGLLFKDKIIDNASYLPIDICREFESSFSVQLSYLQGWRAKKHAKEAISGPPVASYHLIPWMCERLIESIPNTRAIWTSTEDGKFKQLFVAYGCSIMGFMKGCRPFLFIDACHLSGPYWGHLLSATAHDADDGLYPLAYAIVSSKNDDDWLWFLQNLKEVISDRQVVLMTDRDHSLRKGIEQVFGGCSNSWCLRHLKENFSKFASSKRITGNRKQTALKIVSDMAIARSENLYQLHLAKLYGMSDHLGKWVEENDPHHWSNAFFPHKRWDKLYTNLVESLNEWILPERSFDIVAFMKDHIAKTTQLLLRKQTEVQSWHLPVGPNIEKMIKASQEKSMGFTHRLTSPTEFIISDRDRKTFVVKLRPAHCSCLEWQMTGIPCPHACCAIQASDLSVYELVDPILNKDTQLLIYQHVMSNVPFHDMPLSSKIVAYDGQEATTSCPSINCTPLQPPASKRPPGRPKKRMKSQTQEKSIVHCSRCRQPGHNRSSCKLALPA